MKRAIIVHGWGGSPDEGWFPWAKRELEARGYAVDVPAMPNADAPEMAAWIAKLDGVVGPPDAELVLIGHSIGCQTILRYLATIEAQVSGAILVAPWVQLENLESDEEWEIARPWLEAPIDFAAAKAHCAGFTLIFSDDDAFVPPENADILSEALDASAIVLSEKGHINGEAGVTELPEVLHALE